MATLRPLNLIWTSENYHDLHLTRIHLDVGAMDRLWPSPLKPSGVLIVVDHAALPNAPVTETADALHRIDPAATSNRSWPQASSWMVNPRPCATRPALIRGLTDQFAYRFKKPG